MEKRKKRQAGIMISLAASILSACAGQDQEIEEQELVTESVQAEEQEEAEADGAGATDYQIPLEEIAERIEYEYIYENMIDHIAGYDYRQLSFLPSGEDIAVSFYAIEGNKILFLPEEKANTEVVLNNETCNLYYSQEAGGYVFYVLVDWQLSEQGVPVNSLEGDYYHRIRECIVRDKDAVYEEADLCDSPIYFSYEFVSDDLVKLGEAKVTFDPEATIVLPEIAVDDNEYIDAVVEYAAGLLREGQEYGEFQICLETYGRVQEKYGGTRCKISAAVIGETMEEYLFFLISDLRGEINGNSVWPEYYPSLADSPTHFVSEWYLEAEPEDFIPRIVGLQREVIKFEVREEENSREEEDGHDLVWPEYNQEIDFHTMEPEEAVKLLRYVYSYEEWFGMNELGCQTGELRGLQNETINMYAWNNNGESLFFVPESKVNAYVRFQNRVKCPVHVNREGKMEFYQLKRNDYAGGKGQLKTTFFMEDSFPTNYAEDMVWLGETEFTLQELPSLDIAEIEEDEYIIALKEHIEEVLRQNGQSGTYEMVIGEYEGIHINNVCLSAAVSGEEESYYFRYMIVKSEKGNYYFWPVGFGLNDSLEESEAKRHYMNGLCIERTRTLNRKSIVIEVN